MSEVSAWRVCDVEEKTSDATHWCTHDRIRSSRPGCGGVRVSGWREGGMRQGFTFDLAEDDGLGIPLECIEGAQSGEGDVVMDDTRESMHSVSLGLFTQYLSKSAPTNCFESAKGLRQNFALKSERRIEPPCSHSTGAPFDVRL